MYSFPSFESVRCSVSSSNCCFLPCLQVSTGCRVVVLASGICSLVCKVGSGVCAGFRVEGTGSCPLWVDLDLIPLVGRAMSRGMFIVSCELSTTLGILFALSWGCIPVLLVVCSEGLRTRACILLGGARSWRQNGSLLGELTQVSILWGPRHQCPCPHSELQPNPAPLHSSWGPSKTRGGSGPGSFGITALCWIPVHSPRVESLSPPVLWHSRTQASLPFKVRCVGPSS